MLTVTSIPCSRRRLCPSTCLHESRRRTNIRHLNSRLLPTDRVYTESDKVTTPPSRPSIYRTAHLLRHRLITRLCSNSRESSATKSTNTQSIVTTTMASALLHAVAAFPSHRSSSRVRLFERKLSKSFTKQTASAQTYFETTYTRPVNSYFCANNAPSQQMVQLS